MQNTAPIPGTAAMPPVPRVNPRDAKTAQDFEAVFLGQMTQLMLESVERDGGFDGGSGEDMFRGVLAEKLGTEMARRGGIGIAPHVLDQIIRLQQGK